MYLISVFYHDEYGSLQQFEIREEGDVYLTCDDVTGEPLKVRKILEQGIVLCADRKRAGKRSGSVIPAARVVRVWWEDDYYKYFEIAE